MQKFDSILLVDDDSISIYLARYFIEGINLAKKISEVYNGKQALEFLKTNKVDLILLDISMPVMDGFGFLEEAQRTNLCPDTPIVILTSSNDKIDIDRAKDFNEIMGYIVKPLTSNKLEGVFTKYFKTYVSSQ
ncbi:MAG: response regulator [Flavobacteriales bacterium]|nr:response regulator [Flavobacteriales bacterium]